MPRTLLLADDSVTIQRLVTLTLADEDVRVIAVSTGDQAIAALDRTTPPDIVLADVGMPGPDGFEVARHVRRTPRLAHIPVLLMTSAFEPIDPGLVSEVGCHGVLSKPFEPRVIVERVRELLGRPVRPSLAPPVENSAAPPGSLSSAAVERYFEQLDEAFARLTARGPGLPSLREPMLPAPPAPEATSAQPATPSESPPAVPLADAFAALLAAERTATSPPVHPSALPSASAPEAVSDAVIDDVVRRVLERLSDGVIREAVGDAVREVAERLVREEIDRVRAGNG